MGTMNFSIPDDVKERFNELFKDENKSAIIARLMLRAIEDEERRLRQPERDARIDERLRAIRAKSRIVTEDEIRAAREELRK